MPTRQPTSMYPYQRSSHPRRRKKSERNQWTFVFCSFSFLHNKISCLFLPKRFYITYFAIFCSFSLSSNVLFIILLPRLHQYSYAILSTVCLSISYTLVCFSFLPLSCYDITQSINSFQYSSILFFLVSVHWLNHGTTGWKS